MHSLRLFKPESNWNSPGANGSMRSGSYSLTGSFIIRVKIVKVKTDILTVSNQINLGKMFTGHNRPTRQHPWMFTGLRRYLLAIELADQWEVLSLLACSPNIPENLEFCCVLV